MPKGKVTVQEQYPEPMLKTPLQVVEVKETTTARQNYKGLRIELQNEKGERFASMLWQQESYSINTKFGSIALAFNKNFIENGEYDTDEWLGKWIQFLAWERGNRLVERVEAPEGKSDVSPKLA